MGKPIGLTGRTLRSVRITIASTGERFHEPSLDVTGNVLGHLEHCHLLFAAEDRLKRLVGIDQRLLLRILQLVLFDMIPDFLGYFATRQRL